MATKKGPPKHGRHHIPKDQVAAERRAGQYPSALAGARAEGLLKLLVKRGDALPKNVAITIGRRTYSG